MGANVGHSIVLHRNLHPHRNGSRGYGHVLPRMLQCTDGESRDFADSESLDDL